MEVLQITDDHKFAVIFEQMIRLANVIRAAAKDAGDDPTVTSCDEIIEALRDARR